MVRPNVALIVLDGFRYDHLWRRTPAGELCPHLGEFAAHAVSYESAIAPAVFTGPAHAAFFSGKLPVAPAAYTLARLRAGRLPGPDLINLLRAAGYVCVAFSANPWISRTTALGRDFDIVINAPALTSPTLTGFEESPLEKLVRKAGILGRSVLPRSKRQTISPSCRSLLTQTEKMVKAVPTVLRALQVRWPDRPVFLFCNLMVTHDPYLFEPQDADFTRPADAGAARIVPRRFQKGYWLDLLGVQPITAEKLTRLRWSYAASARYADRLAGRLVKSIDESLGSGATDIIFTADHGELLGEYGFFEHGVFLYEPLVHVPLLVRSPALAEGARVDRPVQTHWIWSLILERAGILGEVQMPTGQGDLREAASGRGDETPVYSFADPAWEMNRLRAALLTAAACGVDADRVAPKPMDSHLQAVRLGHRALIRTRSGKTRAFRIEHRTEERELSGAELEEVRQDLEPRLLEMDLATESDSADGVPIADDEVMKRLRDLGYVD